MSKKCTPLWREAHFQVKMYKTHQVRTTFGSWDVEKVHAVVARSTFPSQNVQNTSASDHFWKLRCRKNACRCGAKHISKPKCIKHLNVGPLLEVEMLKKCTPLWREAHFQVKMHKTHQRWTTFGGSDVEKVHAVVGQSTFRSQTVKNTRGSDHFWRFRCRFASLRFTTLHHITLHYTPLHHTTLHYTTLHNTTTTTTELHSTTLHYTKLHYTTLHYTTLHYVTLHYTTFHYTSLHYTTLHYTTTTLHYTTLNCTTLHYITLHSTTLHYTHGSLNVPIEHHPTIRYMVYNGYYKVMSNISKMGQLPTPDTTLHYLPLHFTTLHYTTLHYNYNYDYTTTLHYTPLH